MFIYPKNWFFYKIFNIIVIIIIVVVKMDINNEVIKILQNNNIKPILSGDPRFLATIRIYEDENIEKVLSELKTLFENFENYSICSSYIDPCCAPSFEEIRFKITL